MDSSKKESIAIKIKGMIKSHEAELKKMRSMAEPITPENAIGRVSRMDAINNKGVVDAAIRNKERKVSKLKIALSKIDHPDFGKCSVCKNDIQEARLMFMPESNACVRCAGRR